MQRWKTQCWSKLLQNCGVSAFWKVLERWTMDISVWEGGLLLRFAAWILSTPEQAPIVSWGERSMGSFRDCGRLLGWSTEFLS